MLTPKIYVVILNWNGAEDTLSCLKSLDGIKISNFEITSLVIDNASSDESIDKIEKYKPENCHLQIIKNKINLGFAAGNNIGINYALSCGADYIFILNNDTQVDKNIIEQFLFSVKKYDGIGIFSPKIYFAKGYEFRKKYRPQDLGHVIWSAGGKIDWNNVYASNFGVDEVDRGQFDKNMKTDFATGAAMFVKAEVFRQVGTFDEKYFMYFEDVDFCERYKRKGGSVMYLESAYLWHKVAQSSAIGSELNDYYITRNRLLFGVKYASFRTKLALMKESVKLLLRGRNWQKKGVVDFYSCNLYKGSWK
jgi:GT2 family glycosyltransferase